MSCDISPASVWHVMKYKREGTCVGAEEVSGPLPTGMPQELLAGAGGRRGAGKAAVSGGAIRVHF